MLGTVVLYHKKCDTIVQIVIRRKDFEAELGHRCVPLWNLEYKNKILEINKYRQAKLVRKWRQKDR